MNIAVIAPTYLPAYRANTIQVMKMCQALVVSDADVRLAVPEDYRGQKENSKLADHRWEHLAILYGLSEEFPIQWLPARPIFRRYDYGWRSIRWADSWDADIIYTRLPQAAAIGSIGGKRTILEVHDQVQGVMGPFLFNLFLKGKGAQRVVSVSQTLMVDLMHRFNFPKSSNFAIVLPDGVDLKRYANLLGPGDARRTLAKKSGLPLDPDRFTVGYSGHFYAGRGMSLILEMASQVEDVTFLIVGGEPSHVNLLKEEAAGRSLGNVILTGFIPNSELPGYQAACEVLIMPYQSRVAASSGGDIGRYLSPMKMFEYMASGRIIFSSDLPVLREVLTSQNAVLLPPDDISAWVSALRNFKQNPRIGTDLAEQARRDVERFTWESRAKQILAGI